MLRCILRSTDITSASASSFRHKMSNPENKTPSVSNAEQLEAAADQAIAACGGESHERSARAVLSMMRGLVFRPPSRAAPPSMTVQRCDRPSAQYAVRRSPFLRRQHLRSLLQNEAFSPSFVPGRYRRAGIAVAGSIAFFTCAVVTAGGRQV